MKQSSYDSTSGLVDVTDPNALLALFKQDQKKLTEKES